MLRTIFGSKRMEITGEWKSLHNEEIYDLCPSQNNDGLSNQYRWYARRKWDIQRKRSTFRVLVGKREKNFGNQGIDGTIILHLFLKEMKWEGVDCVNLEQDVIKWRDAVNTLMNLLVEVYVPVRCYVSSLVNWFSTFRNNVASHCQGSKRLKFPPLKMRQLRFLEPNIQWLGVIFEKK